MKTLPMLNVKRLLGIAAFLLLAALQAHADSPVSGAALYSNCTGSGCHNTTTPLTSNATKIYNARNARNWIQSSINNDTGGMGRLSGLTAQQVADIAAYLGNWPSTLSFPSTAVGATSATQTVTVAASLKSGYAIAGMTVSASGDFTRAGGTCGTAVATGTTCTVIVAFMPTATGTRTGTLSIAHSTTLTPVAIALSGTATGGAVAAPVANIAPSSLTLASTAIGSTSAAQNVTVSNTGNAALNVSALTLSNSADFSIAGGTCSVGGSVAAGSSCTVSVAFKPAAGATGVRSGTLSVGHNATGSPGVVSLSATATVAAAPVAALTASLAFGSVNLGTSTTAQTATLGNSGNSALVIGTLSTGSTEFAITGGTCTAGGSVAAGASCTVNVTFTPSTAGVRSANLVVTHNAAGAQSTTSLSGTGVALNPVIGVSPTTLSFSQTINTTSAAQTVTVSNTGNAPLVLSAVQLTGAQAAEYQIAAGTTCVAGGSVAANGSCVVKLSFTPTVVGARTATLGLTHNATGSPSSVALNGSGTAAPQPAISLNATTLSFNAQPLGSTSAPQSVTVTNSGSAPLTFSALTLTGTAATDFTRGGTCSTATALAAGATCTVSFSFTPGAIGARSATLTLVSNASNGAAALGLSGAGSAAAAPAVGLTPSSLAFGNQTIGVASTTRSVTLNNSGSAALSISSIATSSGFGVTHNCGASLAAGASCSLSLSFSPSAAGAASGTASVVSNAAGSPHAVSLSGTGVIASPVMAWTPATSALDFGDLTIGASPAARSLTLSNQGPGSVTLQQLTLAGANAADFSIASGSSCAVNGSLAAGSGCTLNLDFQPGAVGARSATLQVRSSGTNPSDVALSGSGTAMAQPAAAVVPTGLSFTVPAGASTAAAQSLELKSTGNAVLNVGAARVTAGSFTLAPAATNGCPGLPFDLMPGQTCLLAVTWSNTTAASETGLVEIDTNATATPLQVDLQAQRDTAAMPGMSNAGAGGCSIVTGDSLADPTLWLLVLLAAGVLRRRHRAR